MRLRDYTIRSGETLYLTTQIYDVDNVGLGPADLDSLVLTLRDELTHGIINERDGQDVLNVNGGTLDVDGNFTLRLDPDDMGIVHTGLPREWHEAELTWVWTDGVEHTGSASIKFRVRNADYVSPVAMVSTAVTSIGRRFWGGPCGC